MSVIADDEAFVASMLRVAEEHQGPEDIRVPRSVLLRLANLAGHGELRSVARPDTLLLSDERGETL